MEGKLRSTEEAWQRTVDSLDTQLQEMKARGGSTLLLAQVTGREMQVVNLGDSVCLLLHEDDSVSQVNMIHDTHNPGEVQRIETQGGWLIKNRVQGQIDITRSLGDFLYRPFVSQQIEYSRVPLLGVKSVLLLSDGLFKVPFPPLPF